MLGAWRTAEPSDDQVRDAIDRLVYSMRSSILIEDRRDAVKKLLSVSRRYPMVPVLFYVKVCRKRRFAARPAGPER